MEVIRCPSSFPLSTSSAVSAMRRPRQPGQYPPVLRARPYRASAQNSYWWETTEGYLIEAAHRPIGLRHRQQLVVVPPRVRIPTRLRDLVAVGVNGNIANFAPGISVFLCERRCGRGRPAEEDGDRDRDDADGGHESMIVCGAAAGKQLEKELLDQRR
jgi:hypothetical protein